MNEEATKIKRWKINNDYSLTVIIIVYNLDIVPIKASGTHETYTNNGGLRLITKLCEFSQLLEM